MQNCNLGIHEAIEYVLLLRCKQGTLRYRPSLDTTDQGCKCRVFYLDHDAKLQLGMKLSNRCSYTGNGIYHMHQKSNRVILGMLWIPLPWLHPTPPSVPPGKTVSESTHSVNSLSHTHTHTVYHWPCVLLYLYPVAQLSGVHIVLCTLNRWQTLWGLGTAPESLCI